MKKSSIKRLKQMFPLIFIFVMLCSILGLTGCSNSVNTPNTASDSNTYQQITAEEAANMMQSETDYIILDVRTAQEYASGHIPVLLIYQTKQLRLKRYSSYPIKNN